MKSKLKELYPYKTELHAHSLPVSLCSEVYAKELIELYKKSGASSIVLTNHFTPVHIEGCSKDEAITKYIETYRDLRKEADAQGISAILGMELRFSENINDYLVYGIEEDDVSTIYDYIYKGIDVFYSEFKNDKNCIIHAHPFRDNMTLTNTTVIDGIEAFNMHPKTNSRVALAANYAKKNHLRITGGTDFHNIGFEGCCLTRTQERLETSYDVARIIQSQDFVLDIFDNIVLI